MQIGVNVAETLALHPDRLFSAEAGNRAVARELYELVRDLPIISPHGHTDPAWFAQNKPFTDATELLLQPDHYLLRMLVSQGVSLDELGRGPNAEEDRRKIWRIFAENYDLFAATPSQLWLDQTFAEVFGLDLRLDASTADLYFDAIGECLQQAEFRPRALLDRFGIEVLATTESPLNDLRHHRTLAESEWAGRVITTFRPDPVVDPEAPNFAANVIALGEMTDQDVASWDGYLAALRKRRAEFREMGATATDHGHPSALTADLERSECERLFAAAMAGTLEAREAEQFRAQMLTEMAAMSCEDGMVMQLHPGSVRNHSPDFYRRFGPDIGADIPQRTDFVHALRPLLNRFGHRADFRLIVFTLDESAYARELAPLAGHYSALLLGPPWWFHDSPEGMLRYRQQVTETAGFFNTAGFNDDTRAFLSIPARHDVARRMDCRFLAALVTEHRLTESQAADLAPELAYGLAREAYKL